MTTLGLEYLKYKETNRANVTREKETNRSNLANEAIGRSQVALGYANLDETRQANRNREWNDYYKTNLAAVGDSLAGSISGSNIMAQMGGNSWVQAAGSLAGTISSLFSGVKLSAKLK